MAARAPKRRTSRHGRVRQAYSTNRNKRSSLWHPLRPRALEAGARERRIEEDGKERDSTGEKIGRVYEEGKAGNSATKKEENEKTRRGAARGKEGKEREGKGRKAMGGRAPAGHDPANEPVDANQSHDAAL